MYEKVCAFFLGHQDLLIKFEPMQSNHGKYFRLGQGSYFCPPCAFTFVLLDAIHICLYIYFYPFYSPLLFCFFCFLSSRLVPPIPTNKELQSASYSFLKILFF